MGIPLPVWFFPFSWSNEATKGQVRVRPGMCVCVCVCGCAKDPLGGLLPLC